ncbi:MAG: hypothetical protein IJZ89_07805 [Clostridia bacterium]|nr:hypothetical protein [Clostridia bacterium]
MDNDAINAILRDFGHGENATAEQREAAEYLAYKTEEIRKGEYKHD